MSEDAATPDSTDAAQQYVVVARRYRPQAFGELIGQEHVAQALSNAIGTNRVGHAYLFTGARGVGKTSAARILAKALNCVDGPTAEPCGRCDVCESVRSGEDVDVLEIDGASNRGIDEIRQLRQNVNVRPSRARFKIYIIDEVHMLTREAFNALLKTLEEPPEHVKFIFCTTEPTKIPITILSRCQRFDFAGIQTGSIAVRLRQIVDAEGVEAETEALELIARRANGSMRDSQSLLEQLLAFSPGAITSDDVHGMLGTAGEERMSAIVDHLIERCAADALAEIDAAASEGVDVAQLIEQLFGHFRDCMVAAVDCPAELLLYTSPSNQEKVVAAGKQLGLSTILAVMQILDQTLSRMRYSTQGRILAELALVRICALENLDELASLLKELPAGGANLTAAPAKKKAEPVVASPPPSAAPPRELQASPPAPQAPAEPPETETAEEVPEGPVSSVATALTAKNAAAVWNQAAAQTPGIVPFQPNQIDRVEAPAPDRLVVYFKASYAFAKSVCERPDQLRRFQEALAEVVGGPARVAFAVADPPADEKNDAAGKPQSVPRHQRIREAAAHPMVVRAGELFGAQASDVTDPPRRK